MLDQAFICQRSVCKHSDFSVPVNTVYNNMALRGRGDTTKGATETMQVLQDFWQRLYASLKCEWGICKWQIDVVVPSHIAVHVLASL